VISEDVVRGLVHPDDLSEFEENFQRLAASEIPQWSQIIRMRDAEGRWLWIQLDAKPVRRTADDEIAAVAGVMRDITGEREAVANRISAIETEPSSARSAARSTRTFCSMPSTASGP